MHQHVLEPPSLISTDALLECSGTWPHEAVHPCPRLAPLLFIDVIDGQTFPLGAAFAPTAIRTARRIAARAIARTERVPVSFVNDNPGDGAPRSKG